MSSSHLITHCELPCAGIEPNMDGVLEVGGIRNVGLVALLMSFAPFVTFVFLLLGLRFLGERSHVDGNGGFHSIVQEVVAV